MPQALIRDMLKADIYEARREPPLLVPEACRPILTALNQRAGDIGAVRLQDAMHVSKFRKLSCLPLYRVQKKETVLSLPFMPGSQSLRHFDCYRPEQTLLATLHLYSCAAPHLTSVSWVAGSNRASTLIFPRRRPRS